MRVLTLFSQLWQFSMSHRQSLSTVQNANVRLELLDTLIGTLYGTYMPKCQCQLIFMNYPACVGGSILRLSGEFWTFTCPGRSNVPAHVCGRSRVIRDPWRFRVPFQPVHMALEAIQPIHTTSRISIIHVHVYNAVVPMRVSLTWWKCSPRLISKTTFIVQSWQ